MPDSKNPGVTGDNTPAWVEWLKKPENIMTGIVLAAGLAQGRSRQGQSDAGVIGERLLGAMAFRGGLDLSRQQQSERDRQFNSEDQYRRQVLGQGEQKIDLERQQLRQGAESAAQNRDLQRELATTPRPLTPEEAALTRAQAGYYDRMPRTPGGAGEKKGLFEDMYEEKMFEQWAQARTMQGLPMDGNALMEWAQSIQPYRNARIQMQILADNGILGELVSDGSGGWKVRVAGVSDPQAAPSPDAPPAPVTIEPPAPGIAEIADQTRQQREAEAAAEAERRRALAERTRAPSKEELAQYAEDVKVIREQDLTQLLKQKDLPLDQVRVIRAELARRYRNNPAPALP